MTLLFITLPAALIIAAGAVAAFMWAARNDQYEDLDTPPRRMLLEDPKSAPRETDSRLSASLRPPVRSRTP